MFIAGVIVGNAIKQFIYVGFKEPEIPKAEFKPVDPDSIVEYLDPEVRQFYQKYYNKIEV